MYNTQSIPLSQEKDKKNEQRASISKPQRKKENY